MQGVSASRLRSEIGRLETKIRSLERRLANLEHPLHGAPKESEKPSTTVQDMTRALWREQNP